MTQLIRRQIIPCALAALTFAAGVGCTLLTYKFVPPVVTLCDLARYPEWYDQKVVRVTGSASVIYGGAVIVVAECEAEGAWATVLSAEDYKAAPEVKAFLTREAPEVRKAEILVVGRFDKDATRGCFGPRFGVHAQSVELKSPVTAEPLPEGHE